jgi:hypothetical protein
MTRQRTSVDLWVFDAEEPLSVYRGSPGLSLALPNSLWASLKNKLFQMA